VIRRRDLILGFGATAAWPFAARFACSPSWAQQRSGMKRIGCLFSAPSDAPHQVALRDALKRAGFIEGENLSMDWRGYGLQVEQFDDHAAELARSGVDLILAGGDAAVRAAQRATKEIPILALTDDMLGKGFVRSLAKPGNNTTGVTILASELDGKRQEILVQLVPGASRIGALVDTNMATASHIGELKAAARAQGIELSVHAVSRPEEIPVVIDAARKSGAMALNVLASALFYNNEPIIFEHVAAARIPAMYQWPEMARQGGLMGYGPSIAQLYRDVQSRQLIRLLHGAKPADLPVEQPTKFELVVNTKTAKALGLTISPLLLARADEVIE
jgi:putative tryptophan/tyrosine transport system substrate-binding protein